MNTVVTTPTQMKNAYTVDSNGVVRIFIHSKKHGDFVIMIDVDDLPEVSQHLKRTPSSRQKRARIKIVCYRYEPKYTDAGG